MTTRSSISRRISTTGRILWESNYIKCIVYFYISAAKVSANVTKLVKNKRYYVSVRCYKTVGKVTYYSVWSAAKNTVVKK